MINIPLTTRTFDGLNVLRVEVGSNCPRGGDSGHGGRTVLRFINEASTDMRIRVDDEASVNADSIELIFGGDSEHQSVIEALEFAVTTLKAIPDTGRSMAQVE